MNLSNLAGGGASSLISTVKASPKQSLGNIAGALGLGASADALKSGRMDKLAGAMGKDLLGRAAGMAGAWLNKGLDRALGKQLEMLKALDKSDPPPAGEVLLMLGEYPFMVGTLAHQSMKRNTDFRWAKQDRLARAPAYQFVGTGDDKITLEGYTLPHYLSSTAQLDLLRDYAGQGESLDLLDHDGVVFGRFAVLSISETRSELDMTGKPRRVEFQLDLARYGDDV